MIRRILSFAILAALPMQAAAASPGIEAWRLVDASQAIIEDMGHQIDADHDGMISADEMDRAAREVFAAIDTDLDGVLTRGELFGWKVGMAEIAAFRGREQAYAATMNLVFDLLDRDGSNGLDAEEHAGGLVAARAMADRDGDGTMSLAEFRDAFLVSTAFRRALVE
ncbi:hypothetical protein MWU52_08000 [Jannaschia sp. S6380]|uniref:EF-hand domain-containing protein n=1 Tax=Jannaschia sp. S6380 TaxID=2926408 RepID=UPI001FF2D670|nr:hypothetical protein [Jannaschia sp. S6380]MCK0167486.1 hypothetical protein [Jannaschia sp. S6380]